MTSKSYRSQIFTQYNRAKSALKHGKIPTADLGRMNRALGLLLSGKCTAAWDKYGTTINYCSCPDHQHGHTCKHMLARWMAYRAGLTSAAPQTHRIFNLNGRVMASTIQASHA